MVDHLRPWDQPLREVLSGEATGKWLLGHEFPTFYNHPTYWESSGWVYEEGTVGSEAGRSPYAKHDDYGGYVRSRKTANADTATGYRIRNKEAEIALAIESGLDGFVHNLTDATPGSTFERRWLDLAEAAENMHAAGTLGDFRIALCPDGTTGGTPRNAPTDDPTDLEDLIVEHGARNSCLRLSGYDDKQLLFSFSPEAAPAGTSSGGATAANWWIARKTAVAARGEPVVFAAIFRNTWTATAQAPSFTVAADIMGRWGGSDWSSVTGGNNDNANACAYAMSQYGKEWVHWSRWQDARPYSIKYWEAWGSTLLRNTWAVIEASDPFMVQSITWDDYSECSEFYPGDPFIGFAPSDVQLYHAIKWKLGAFPTIVRDGLFLFHRVQPRGIATVDYLSSQQTAFMPTTPESGGAAKDEVEVLAYLKAPATVYVVSGGAVTPFAGSAGENSFKVPLLNGTVHAYAVRSGVTVASVTSPWEVSTTQLVQNFKYTASMAVSEEDEEGEPLSTPDTISDLIGWWEPNTGTNGATVNPWSSTGSYGPDLDDTAGTAPTLDTSVAINGYNGTRFTSSRTLRQTTGADLTGFTNGIGGASMFVVAKLDDATGSTSRNAAVVSTATVGASRYALRCITGVPQWGARRADGVGSSLLNGSSSIGTSAAHILSGTIDYASTTQKLYVDAAEAATSSSALTTGTTSTTSAGMAIGSHSGTATEGWPGVIYEVILYSRALTTLERMTVHAYLSDKYSITIADALILPQATFGTMTTTIPEPNVGLDASITPARISTATTVPSAAKSGGALALPAAISTTSTTPSRTVSGGALFLAALTTTTTTAPSRTVSGGATSVPAVVSTTTTTPARTVSGGATLLPSAASTTTSTPSAAVLAGGAPTPSLVSTTTALAAPGVATSGNATISATTVVSTVGTIPAAAVSAGSVFPASLVSTLTTTPVVTVAGHVFIVATAAGCVVSVPSVALSSGVTGEPAAVSAPVSFIAGVLTITADATPASLLTVGTFPLAGPSASIEFGVASFEVTSSVPAVVTTGGADPEPIAVLVPVVIDLPTVTVPPFLIRARGREISTHVPRGREVT